MLRGGHLSAYNLGADVPRLNSDLQSILQVFSRLRDPSDPYLNLRGVSLRKIVLGGGYLGEVDFSGSLLDYSYFSLLDLRGADFRAASLHGAKFIGVDLRSVSMENTDLSYASFVQCSFENASLGGADLTGAFVFRSNLDYADFGGTILEGARLDGIRVRGANFVGVKGLERERIGAVCGSDTTRLPDGFKVPSCSEPLPLDPDFEWGAPLEE